MLWMSVHPDHLLMILDAEVAAAPRRAARPPGTPEQQERYAIAADAGVAGDRSRIARFRPRLVLGQVLDRLTGPRRVRRGRRRWLSITN